MTTRDMLLLHPPWMLQALPAECVLCKICRLRLVLCFAFRFPVRICVAGPFLCRRRSQGARAEAAEYEWVDSGVRGRDLPPRRGDPRSREEAGARPGTGMQTWPSSRKPFKRFARAPIRSVSAVSIRRREGYGDTYGDGSAVCFSGRNRQGVLLSSTILRFSFSFSEEAPALQRIGGLMIMHVVAIKATKPRLT